MGNRFNYRCPKCGRPDEIEIDAIVSVRLTSTGTEGDASNCGPDVRGDTTPLGKGTRSASPLHPLAGEGVESRAVPILKGRTYANFVCVRRVWRKRSGH